MSMNWSQGRLFTAGTGADGSCAGQDRISTTIDKNHFHSYWPRRNQVYICMFTYKVHYFENYFVSLLPLSTRPSSVNLKASSCLGWGCE